MFGTHLRDGVVSDGLVTKTHKVVVEQRSEKEHVPPANQNNVEQNEKLATGLN